MKKSALSQMGCRTAPPPISWLMNLPLERPELISLAAGFTDNETLPVAESKAALGRILRERRRGQMALQYGTGAGEEELRILTVERVRQQDGAKASAQAYAPGRLLVTHGSQQLLYLVAQSLCDPGDLVLVEDPTYFVFLSILQSHGARCRGVRMEGDGLDLSALEAVLRKLQRAGQLSRVKLLYFVTYFQNPTGISTSFQKKKAALEIVRSFERAAGHPIYILEDAAYREMRFAGSDIPSALSVPGAEERLIYAGTYSKPFATGVRVGFGFIPEPLRTVILRLKGNHDFGTSHLLQEILLEAIRSGLYSAHLPMIRKRYAEKASAMVRALRAYWPSGPAWKAPEGGMYLWAHLPGGIHTGRGSKVFERALAANVLYVPGELCYAEDPSRPTPKEEMRLSFACANEAAIKEGIRRLGCILSERTAARTGAVRRP